TDPRSEGALGDRCRGSSPAVVGGDAGVGQPYVRGQLARLPENVDGNPTARIPIAADAQKSRLEQADELLSDGDRAVLVEGADVTEAAEIELERFRFEKPFSWHVVDHQMSEVGLPGDRA